jgi:hypothetical protein
LVILKEFDCVKIISLLDPDRQYDGTEGVKRTPQIGDEGTIVHVYTTDGKAAGYVVENVNQEGYTIWLADFLPEEINLIID